MFEGLGKFLLSLDLDFYVDNRISLSKFLSVVLGRISAAKNKGSPSSLPGDFDLPIVDKEDRNKEKIVNRNSFRRSPRRSPGRRRRGIVTGSLETRCPKRRWFGIRALSGILGCPGWKSWLESPGWKVLVGKSWLGLSPGWDCLQVGIVSRLGLSPGWKVLVGIVSRLGLSWLGLSGLGQCSEISESWWYRSHITNYHILRPRATRIRLWFQSHSWYFGNQSLRAAKLHCSHWPHHPPAPCWRKSSLQLAQSILSSVNLIGKIRYLVRLYDTWFVGRLYWALAVDLVRLGGRLGAIRRLAWFDPSVISDTWSVGNIRYDVSPVAEIFDLEWFCLCGSSI